MRPPLGSLEYNGIEQFLADDTADSGLGRPNAALRIELEANRSGVISLQKHSIAFERAGYGLHYNDYYGGI